MPSPSGISWDCVPFPPKGDGRAFDRLEVAVCASQLFSGIGAGAGASLLAELGFAPNVLRLPLLNNNTVANAVYMWQTIPKLSAEFIHIAVRRRQPPPPPLVPAPPLALLHAQAQYDVPLEIWAIIFSFAKGSLEAATLACTCSLARQAYRESKWPDLVRIKRDGTVLEPSSGRFDVTVAPGDPVYGSIVICPAGGSVLLLPGVHKGRIRIFEKEVHVFGRHLATLWSSEAIPLVRSSFPRGSLVGLTLQHIGSPAQPSVCCLSVTGGFLRVQACNITARDGIAVEVRRNADPTFFDCSISGSENGVAFFNENAIAAIVLGRFIRCAIWGCGGACVSVHHDANPTFEDCSINDSATNAGVFVYGAGAHGQFLRCRIYNNLRSGVFVSEGGDPTLLACSIYNHPRLGNDGVGVYVTSSSFGLATVDDCDFENNTVNILRRDEDELDDDELDEEEEEVVEEGDDDGGQAQVGGGAQVAGAGEDGVGGGGYGGGAQVAGAGEAGVIDVEDD